MARAYAPFYMGTTERGSDKKCPICGIPQRNQHTLGQAAECDWLRRPLAERKRLTEQRESSRKEVA